MTVKSPSYITKSSHGVYYFQIRADKILKTRLGISSKIYRKSLRTKDRKLALRLARRLWVNLYSDNEEWFAMSKIPKVGTKEYDLWENEWKDAERVKSKSIRIALEVDERLNVIPKWDFDSRERFIEDLNPEEYAAMEYISESGITLDDYREESQVRSKVVKKNKGSGGLESRKLSELLNQYLDDVRSNKVANRTVNLYRDQIMLFIELVTDMKSDELSYDDVNYYKASLSKVPKNRNKVRKYRNIPLKKLIKMEIQPTNLLSDSSLKTYSTNVKVFLEWATKRKFVASEAVSALDNVFKKATQYPYLPFSDNDLVKIFLSSAYLKGEHKSASRYWIPLIALYTGARVNEICQLAVSDIKSEQIDGTLIHYFDINDDDYKSLKNKSSKRIVPVHITLIQLDFLEFVERVKKSKHKRLFSELKEKDGKFSHDFSKWFSRYLKSCGVESIPPDRRKVFHSFRHTFANRLRSSKDEIPIEAITELVGHAHKGTTLKVYANELALERKFEIISKLKFNLKLSEIRIWRK